MGGDQFVARKRGPPITLAARDKDGVALFISSQALDRRLIKPVQKKLGLNGVEKRVSLQELRPSTFIWRVIN
jgi:hypothetical protein